jgi:hypothetical protein
MAVPAFIFSIIAYTSYAGLEPKIKRLNSKMRKLNKELEGEVHMSKMISDLVGKKCVIGFYNVYLAVGKDKAFEVLEVDEEWVKLAYNDRKDQPQISIIRVEEIKSIELL